MRKPNLWRGQVGKCIVLLDGLYGRDWRQPHSQCVDDMAYEAWERMTYGGCDTEGGPGVFSLKNCVTTIFRERVRRAAR